MGEIALHVDERQSRIQKGSTILEAGKSVGIYIPARLDHDDIKEIGSCKLCVADVKGQSSSPTFNMTQAGTEVLMQGMLAETKRLTQMEKHNSNLLSTLKDHTISYRFCFYEHKDECTELKEGIAGSFGTSVRKHRLKKRRIRHGSLTKRLARIPTVNESKNTF